ncbi:hypothetical protein W97_00720 [Coniosporium apollinis CBS 100218]|uniref:FAD-binding domain-containing protein n=1 Tax=Coniosporium apollinis (strain CBS 100218) TaxID=1168221 RepID=R7YHY3_CONA1|nr:uncharacterized protein W97_00720 [Coniosporium apollinis CBS 100218]EON61505.1 hypothetical protein W97_00720 [Coniosporium apollinis CBS 100218]
MPGLTDAVNGTYPNGVNGKDVPSGIEDNIAIDVPVLVVGGGPTGLLLAHLLSKLGVRSLLVEKYPERLGAPKAHALSPRSLEICRQFGLDTKAIRNLGTKRADAFWVNFVTNLSGERIGILPYERMDPAVLESTPEMIHNIPQPSFEQFVAHVLSNDPQVEIRKGVAFVSCTQNENEVITTVEERATRNQFRIRSEHVIACDGARSQVRSQLGIESEGEDSYETMMTIHFNADLRPVVQDRVGMLHWIMDPAASGFIIGYDLSGNQVLISNFDSDKHPVDTWTEGLCHKVVTAAIGREVLFDVLSYRPWILSRKVAKKYHSGNVFLAGDAAHSFPPTGGLGLNSGIADVHNIAYKIAAVHQGWGSKALLQSYGSERRQVAEINSKQSVKNGKKIFSFLKTLGAAGIADVEEARKNLFKSIRDPSKKSMIRDQVEGQREHFDNLELHIGSVYGSTETPSHASHYKPKFQQGARLPHAWISFRNQNSAPPIQPLDVSYVTEFSPDEVHARRFSSLDLCALDGFTVVVGSHEEWAARFDALKAATVQWAIKLRLYAADTDFDFMFHDHRDLFDDGAHLSTGGGLLVRPDQHILLELTADVSVEDLQVALSRHLGL